MKASPMMPNASLLANPNLPAPRSLALQLVLAGLLAIAAPLAWAAAVEPDRPVSTPGLGNAGKPVDPGFDEGPARALPRCLAVGCTVIIDPAAAPRRSGNAPLLACAPGNIRCKPLAGGRQSTPVRR